VLIEAKDSFLTVRSFPGEVATLSGAVALRKLSWQQVSLAQPGPAVIWRAAVPTLADMPGLRVNGRRASRARYPNIADIETVGSQGPLEGFIAQQPPVGLDGWGWIPANASVGVDHISTAGDWPGVEWVATQTRPAGTPFGTPGVHTQGTGGGTCNALAVSTAYFCGAHITRGNSLLHRGPVGLRRPEDVLPRARQYANVSGAVVHMWRANSGTDALGQPGVGNGLWGTLQWEISHRDTAGSFIFNQAWGHTDGGGLSGWRGVFFENVKEELDLGGEWFFDTHERQLYYVSNATDGRPPADGELEAVVSESLVVVRGTQATPVRNVTLSNISLQDTVATFLTPHENPSGGDWGLVHSAAVFAHGTESMAVDGCHISRVDGQGILLDGYTRAAAIVRSELDKIGSHAIITWGKTSPCLNANCSRTLPFDASGPDGRGGAQPIGTLVEGNIISETGVFERHGTMIFSSLSARTVVRRNVMFNSMRAAVNYQDGFGGGHWLHENLIANAGRGRNKDEGYVNAWDRLPYITTIRNGTASTEQAINRISQNFVLGTYNVLLDVDTDDSASFYDTFDNVLAYGGYGRKGACNARDVRSYRNVFYWLPRPTYSGANGPDWSNNNGWFANNTVVLSGSPDPCGVPGGYASDCPTVGLGSACDFGDASLRVNPRLTGPNRATNSPVGMRSFGNTIMSADWATMKVPARCGNHTLQQWLSKGHDPGTKVVPVQSWPVLLAAMRKKLGLQTGLLPLKLDDDSSSSGLARRFQCTERLAVHEADQLKGGAVNAVASWRNGATATLSALAGQSVALRVTMTDGKLFSLRLACAPERVKGVAKSDDSLAHLKIDDGACLGLAQKFCASPGLSLCGSMICGEAPCVALRDRGATSAAKLWRCYNQKYLTPHHLHYINGSGSHYCTRDAAITQIVKSCHLPPAPKPLPGYPGFADTSVYEAEVFVPGEGGYPCIRIPSVALAGDNKTLNAFAECRNYTGDGCFPLHVPPTREGLVKDICQKQSTK
jgi:hypothetical protein